MSDEKLYTITGKVSALSHVLRTKPKAWYVEIISRNNHVYRVLNRLREQRVWQKDLKVDMCLTFTDVKHSKVTLCGSELLLFETTLKTQCKFVPEFSVPLPSSSLINYNGMVTDVNPSLAECTLDDKIILNFSFMYERSDITTPCVGQEVFVRNAHSLQNVLFLCGRSRVDINGTENQSDLNGTVVPLVVRVMKSNLAFSDVLWLRKQFSVMERKFNDLFLTNIGFHSEGTSKIGGTILYIVSDKIMPAHEMYKIKRAVTLEFLNHEVCSLNRPALFTEDFPTISSILNNCALPSSQWFWNHKVTHHKKSLPLIVYLSILDGCWIAKDATGSLPCIVSLYGYDKSPAVFANKIVCITQFSVVTEELQMNNGKEAATKLIYIHFSLNDVFVVYESNKISHRNLCSECGGIGTVEHICTAAAWTQHEKMRCGNDRIRACASKEPDQKDVKNCYRSIKVIIHHKTSLMIKSSEGQHYYMLLVTLAESDKVEDVQSTLYYLILKDSLLAVPAVLKTDALYELELPLYFRFKSDMSSQFFVNPTTVKAKECVDLPLNTTFHEMRKEIFCADWYSVSDSLSQDVKGVISLEGVIVDRLHKDAHFDSEKINYNVPGFGVPSNKTIILKIEDKSGAQVSLYLKCWHQREYPKGLIPGAHICALYVEKKVSNNLIYFVSTFLSKIDVIDFNGISSLPNDDWGPPKLISTSYLPYGIVWGSVTIHDVLSVSLQMMCKHCNTQFKDNHCSYVGCHSTAQPEMKACMKFTAEEALGRLIFTATQDLTRIVLQLSEQEWSDLCSIAKEHGELLYLKKKKPPHNDILSKMVFYEYCKQIPVGRRVHIRCRRIAGRVLPYSNYAEHFSCLYVGDPDLSKFHSILPQS